MKTKSKKAFAGILITVITFLVIAFLFSPTSEAKKQVQVKEATLKIDNQKLKKETFSSVYKPNFSFNMLVLKWEGDKGADYQVRVFKDQWSEWYNLERLADDIKDPVGNNDTNFSEPLFFDSSQYFQIKAKSGEKIVNLEIVVLDTKEEKKSGLLERFFQGLVTQAKAITLDIISRREWNADESWRLNSRGEEIWEREYQKVEKIIIHHTAGSDGGNDPAAVIRGIYYYHAVTRGWGDIGYHYLIDPNGNIYEGRYGGDGVVGGHAYNEARDVSYNYGTLGIAILGNYENTDTLTSAAQRALTDLIAVKARDFGFRPKGSSVFMNEKLPNVIGHKDVDSTLCPGRRIYNKLSEIRQNSQTKYNGLPDLPSPKKKASFVRQSDTSLTLEPGETKQIWVEYKNTGNSTWKSYVESTPYLAVEKESSLKDSTWTSDLLVTEVDGPNVKPGETGRFTFKIKAPTDRIRVDQNFYLKWDETWISGTEISLHLEITGHEYAANAFEHNILPATFQNTQRSVTLSYKNVGLNTWKKDDISLYILNESNNKSPYYYSSWPDELGKIKPNESEIKSQGTATFTFTMSSPGVSLNRTYFKIVRSNGEVIPGSLHSVQTRVDSTYQAEVSEHTVPTAVLNSWHVPVTLKFKNKGLTTWDRNVVLKVYDGDWRNSAFSNQTWPTPWGDFSFREYQVRPGETATFNLTLFPPAWKGIYYTIFKLEYRGRPDVVVQGDFPRLIRVDASGASLYEGYQADFLSVSAPPAMLQLQRITNEVKIKNTGTQTWSKDIVLNVYDADFRETYFRDLTWPAFAGSIRFQESRVGPGETATFRFVYSAPWKTGLYRNRFTLAISGKEYLVVPGSEDSWLTRVDPR